ncbi:MAG: ABC transporter ATP-binding protein [Actinobacteria bacterium]|nr:MAG: ABC transporter ATP-binding protein [Actinomycetota bacterium]
MTTLGNGAGGPGAALLELVDVSSAYGPFRAIFDVSFSLPEGSATALLGPNGAGKSTVARVCTGLVPVTSGQLRYRGEDITGLPAWRIARMGIAHAPEGRSVFSSLTVEENLVLTFREALGRKHMREATDRAYEAFPRLGERRKQSAGTLSGGEQRILSLAKVLANPPRLLVVDELSLGLAPIVLDDVFRILGDIRRAGTTLLIVEQHVGRALQVSDHAVLLNQGRVVHHGRVDELGDAIDQLLPGTPAR